MLTSFHVNQLQQSHALLQRGQVGQALDLCNAVLQSVPNQADALNLLALIQKAQGQLDKAIQTLQLSLSRQQSQPAALNNLANIFCDQGRLNEALPLYRRAVTLDPRYVDGWKNLGHAAHDLGLFVEAENAYKKAIALAPTLSEAWNGLGRCYRSQNLLEEAITAFRQALSANPKNVHALVNMGSALCQIGQAREALDCAQRARELGFSGPEVGDIEAASYLELGAFDQGIAAYKALVSKTPDYLPAQTTLAKFLWEHGLPEDPAAALKQAVRDQPQNRALWVALLHIAVLTKNWALVDDYAARALSQFSDDPAFLHVQTYSLEARGELEPATTLFERALERMPQDSGLWMEFSRHLLLRRMPERAEEVAAKAILFNPDNQMAWGYRGTAWRLLGDPREHWLHDYDSLVVALPIGAPSGFQSLTDFMRALKDHLLELHSSSHQPIDQTLRGGTQTMGSLLSRPDPLIQAVRQEFQRVIDCHVKALPGDDQHPFRRKCKGGPVRFVGSWSVNLSPHGHHVSHAHPQGWLSSAFYVSLPDSMGSGSDADPAGCIQFGAPPETLGLDDLPPRRIIRPQEGHLVLFPSYTWHGTLPFEGEASRLTIAFDALPA